MIESTNAIFGIIIILLNLVPILLKKQKYLQITIPISLLLGAIRVLFMN